jgi:hypothetical protein
VLDAPTDDVKAKLDVLPEISTETLLFDPSSSGAAGSGSGRSRSPFSALWGLFPGKKLSTGIEIEWLDDQTADIHALQYSDWPDNPEDEANLPMKQRQRLADHLMIYVEPTSDNGTRISYELEVPAWIYVLSGAIVVFLLWIAWAVSGLVADKGYAWIRWDAAVLWFPLTWIATRIIVVFRLQSISLLDNVISTFGSMDPRHD